jgi:hypothetical protein
MVIRLNERKLNLVVASFPDNFQHPPIQQQQQQQLQQQHPSFLLKKVSK